jgi:hypothetical protein
MSRARKHDRRRKRGTKVSRKTAQYLEPAKIGVQTRHEAPIGPESGPVAINEMHGVVRIDDDPFALELARIRRRELAARAGVTCIGVGIVAVVFGVVFLIQQAGVL